MSTPNVTAGTVRPGSYARTNRDIIRFLLKPSASYLLGLTFAIFCLGIGVVSLANQFYWGMGMAGTNNASFWGTYIVTFVFWVGIGHAGTLIGAILFLVRSKWRNGVYRASEAMTVFAVMTAGLFPVLHLGRMWQVYWFFPYPNQRILWVNFKSPLMWDVFAISTYFTVSAVFFYIDLLPDFAIVRDHNKGLVSKVYNLLALGWRGTGRQWHSYMAAYGFFAAFAAPLVLSVHSVVSWDFAMANTAGWHSTIFPPYFVAGAIFSGMCHGYYTADAHVSYVRMEGVRKHLALRKFGQDVHAYERHSHLCVFPRVFRRMVQPEPIRMGDLLVACNW